MPFAPWWGAVREFAWEADPAAGQLLPGARPRGQPPGRMPATRSLSLCRGSTPPTRRSRQIRCSDDPVICRGLLKAPLNGRISAKKRVGR